MIAPMLAPPTKVERYARLAQRANDAEMCEAASAAARQDQADSAPRQQARDPAHVAGIDDVMMLRDGQMPEPAARGAGGEGALVQQRELDARAAGGGGGDARSATPAAAPRA